MMENLKAPTTLIMLMMTMIENLKEHIMTMMTTIMETLKAPMLAPTPTTTLSLLPNML